MPDKQPDRIIDEPDGVPDDDSNNGEFEEMQLELHETVIYETGYRPWSHFEKLKTYADEAHEICVSCFNEAKYKGYPICGKRPCFAAAVLVGHLNFDELRKMYDEQNNNPRHRDRPGWIHDNDAEEEIANANYE